MKEPLKPVYFLYGAEDYLMGEYLEGIRARSLAPGFESMNYHLYYRDQMDASEVLSSAGTMPAFSGKRLVVVKGAASLNAAEKDVFLEYIKDPSPTTCLVFLAETNKVARGEGFFKVLDEKGYLKRFASMNDTETLAWIKRQAGVLGKSIEAPAAGKLLELTGGSLRDIKGELEKIALFVGEKPAIEASDVEDAGLDCRQETIFKLSDAIGAKDLEAALRIYSKISTEPPVMVLSAISRHIRILLKIKGLLKKRVPGSRFSSMLGVPPWFLDTYLAGARHFREEELKEALKRFLVVDRTLKTGRMPAELAMSGLIIELCTAR